MKITTHTCDRCGGVTHGPRKVRVLFRWVVKGDEPPPDASTEFELCGLCVAAVPFGTTFGLRDFLDIRLERVDA